MIAIRLEFPDARIIMLTTFEGDAEIQRALQSGARTYLLKSTPPKELVDLIRKARAGKKPIPPEIAAHRKRSRSGCAAALSTCDAIQWVLSPRVKVESKDSEPSHDL